jgi:organic radical activating enzyme
LKKRKGEIIETTQHNTTQHNTTQHNTTQHNTTQLYRLYMRLRKYLPRKMRLRIQDIHYKIYGRKMPWSHLLFEVHLTDKCSLNCSGCLHFSSLCKDEQYLCVDDFEEDCKRISVLTNGIITDIKLLGGEPLLHPNVNDIITMTRKYFPTKDVLNDTGVIELVTNGILLPKQEDEFWKKCRDNAIRIVISDYPIKIERKLIKAKAKLFNVDLKMYSDEIKYKVTGSSKQWAKIPIDTNGLQDYRESFGKCFLAGNCFQLVKGKIFKCARIAYINYFNTMFNQQLKIDENDYVDIYNVNDINEILFKLSTLALFCRYCKTNEITWCDTWKVSKMEINEYI